MKHLKTLPLIKKIESPNNPLIKHLIKLRKDKKYRKEKKQVFLSGQKIIEDLTQKLCPQILITYNKASLGINIKPKLIIHTTFSIMKKITNLPHPQKVAALFPLPSYYNLEKKKHLLILDEISDPGNLGTLFRSALALGWEGVLILPNCADPFNEKAIRASEGAVFFLPFDFKKKEDVKKLIKKEKFQTYVADIKGEKVENISIKPPLILIMSNESRGVGAWTYKLGKKISIPISNINSLNVAIAGSILMYLLKRY